MARQRMAALAADATPARLLAVPVAAAQQGRETARDEILVRQQVINVQVRAVLSRANPILFAAAPLLAPRRFRGAARGAPSAVASAGPADADAQLAVATLPPTPPPPDGSGGAASAAAAAEGGGGTGERRLQAGRDAR